MMTQTAIEDKKAIAQKFSRAARYYDEASFIQKEIGHRLLERCQWLKQSPQTILNIGSATGRLAFELQKLYPKAQIIGLDHAWGMSELSHQKRVKKFFKNTPSFLCADMEILPFRAKTFDLIISNCTLEWSRALPGLALEFKRVLKENGNLLFTTVGPDTLRELAQSSHEVDGHYHVNAFLDMHHVGDILLKSGLNDPVMDREIMTITYSEVQSLLSDIQKTGSGYLFQNTPAPFQGKKWLAKLVEQYNQFKMDNRYPASIEIIYGYACKLEDKSIPTHILTSNDC